MPFSLQKCRSSSNARQRTFSALVFIVVLVVWMLYQNQNLLVPEESSSSRLSESSYRNGITLKGNKHQEIVFLTFVDRVIGGLCLGMETAAMSGLELGVLGVGLEGKFEFLNKVENVKTRKLFAFQLALTDPELKAAYGITNDTIVSLNDGTDVLYLKSSNYILERYQALERASPNPNNFVLVGAERNCWPYMKDNVERLRGGKDICEKFPEVNSTFKYLNSGSIMGRASTLLQLLQNVMNAMQSVNDDDQLCLQKAYLNQVLLQQGNISSTASQNYYIGLDTRQEIFQVAWATNLAGRDYAQYQENGAYYDESSGKIVNTEHGVFPATVHINGNKRAFLPIAQHYVQFFSRTEKRQMYQHVRQSYVARYPWFENECIPELTKLGLQQPNSKSSLRGISMFVMLAGGVATCLFCLWKYRTYIITSLV